MASLSRRLVTLLGLVASCPAATQADQALPDLAKYFGWDPPRIIVLDRGAGPALTGDFNGDGLTDLAAANNAKSRIEIHLQRKTPRTEQEITREFKVNELPPSPFYDRVEVSVAHRIGAMRTHDVDGDGRLDFVYAGAPDEIVIMRQSSPMKFDVLSKRRVKGLEPGQDAFEIADVMGDAKPELLAAVSGRVNVYGLTNAAVVGEPLELGTGGSAEESILAFFIEDYNGDGLQDVMAAIPDAPTPIRIWLQGNIGPAGTKQGQLGPELRFEAPPLRELEPVRFPDRAAASIAYIERPSRRIVLTDLTAEGAAASGNPANAGGPASPGAGTERDASAEVFVFPGPTNKTRSILTADIDADGLLDLFATDQQANTIVMYRQQAGVGLSGERRFSALKDPRAIAAGQWDADPALEIFVLSEADKVVGIADYDVNTQTLAFPQPLALATAGASPVAMGYAGLKSGPALAVVVKDKRDHTLEVHRSGSAEPAILKLEGVNRPPQSMLSGDFDHDGQADLVLFTPGEPLVMVRSIEGASSEMQLLTDKAMPQFGLVQAAGPDNTAMFDIDGDGFDELLVADQNFVRACEFKANKGWRVVEQITLPESSATLVGLAVLTPGPAAGSAMNSMGQPTIVAADKANKRLVLMSRDAEGRWSAADRLRFGAFDVTQLRAGAFTGEAQPTILASSESAFALVRLAGQRFTLDEFAAFRSDSEDRLEHEIEAGDMNSDGFVDLICLDAREQMAQVFTMSKSRRLFLATEFEVFESRLFGRGETREFEPSAAMIADLTGDSRADLILQVHDRYVIFPQMSTNP